MILPPHRAVVAFVAAAVVAGAAPGAAQARVRKTCAPRTTVMSTPGGLVIGFLAGLFLAAGLGGRDLKQVYEWLNDPVLATPVRLLQEHGVKAADAVDLARIAPYCRFHEVLGRLPDGVRNLGGYLRTAVMGENAATR